MTVDPNLAPMMIEDDEHSSEWAYDEVDYYAPVGKHKFKNMSSLLSMLICWH